MAAAAGAAVLAGGLWLYPGHLRLRAPPGTGPSPSADTPARQRLRRVHWEAVELLQAGHYAAAAAKFEAGWQDATRAGDGLFAARFLNNLGACRVATFRYREGMAAYLAARNLALERRDWENAAVLEGNVAELYARMGQNDLALQAAESALAWLQGRPVSAYRAQLLFVLGKLRASTGQLDSAVRLLSEAVQAADRQGDSATQAQAWGEMGVELMRAGQLEAAEQALLESFRLRKLTRDRAIVSSYRALGLLRMAQGDLNSASRLLDQAVAAAAKSPQMVPFWRLHHDRGRVRMAQGLLPDALDDFRQAVDSARRWRPEVLPADPARVSVDTGLQELYASLVEAGNRLYFLRGDLRLARETFEAAEENRAYSLRMLVAEPQEWREKLPPEYGETLLRLRNAEAATLTRAVPSASAQIRQLNRDLMELEARGGMDLVGVTDGATAGPGLVDRLHACLDGGEALLSFHLGEPDSYLWGITREGFELRKLPSRSHLRLTVGRFVEAIQQGAKESAGLAETLYEELLGSLKESTRRKPRWLLTLDDVLFGLPFAALAEDSGPGGLRYLIEGHSLQVVPSAHLLVSARARRRPPPGPGGIFVGIGDPVYNSADPRWVARPGLALAGRKRLELPRLAGSAREIRACARLWSAAGAAPLLLEGTAATGEEVLKKLENHPAVAHFATHVVASSRKRGLIALSLLPSGETELIAPLDILHRRRSPSLVVLSGCSSAQGEALPGAGLMGLTRAWLAAGADTVVATRWPTPDDAGELFLSFYRRLLGLGGGREGVRPAAALQQAQREVLHSGSWRSAPRYWAAFFAVGTE